MHVRPGPLRLTMIGPMFRYDRPQAGRYRQFVQWDVEVIGDAGPSVDAELVELGHRFYAEVGIRDVVARINSIGDAACRPAYRDALIGYFEAHEDRLSADSRRRLGVNPLRVLDDKELPADLAEGAPRSIDHLCGACREHFDTLTSSLLTRSGCATRSTIGWCADSTTTRAPRSSSTWPVARASSRRWAVAAATTG